MIPFALGQRNSNNRGGHAALAASAPTKNVAPVASDYLKVPTAPSSVRFSWETPHLAKKLSGWPMVTGQTGAREIRVPLKPERPAGSCTWSIVANYPLVIESPSVCSDGTFGYAAGGLDASTFAPTDAFNRYDPLLDTWTPLANLPTAVGDARSVYAANTNSIYVFGGITDFFNGTVTDLVQIYDVAAGTWTTGTPMPAERFFPATVYYNPNGKIYVAGGIDGTFFETNTTWEYDPVADTWNTSLAPIPVAMGGSAVSLVGQNMYLQGSFGDTGATDLNYRYDIVADSWTQMAPMPRAKYEAVGAAIGTKTYVVAGGNPSLGPQASAQDRKLASIRAPATSFNTTFIYDTTTDTWFTGPNTNVRHSFTGGTAIGDLLLVVGGFDGSSDTNTVEKGELVACTPTPTPTCTPPPPTLSGLVVGDGLAIGFAPNNFQQIASNIVNYTFCKSLSAPNDFAIFQTHNPWGYSVVADAIACGGHNYQVFTPDQLAGFDFSQYRVVILNWDDTFLDEFSTQYDAAIPALEAYAAAGGVVWVQGAIQGSEGEDCYRLPFGGQSCVDFGFSDPIVDPSNPMVEGVPSPITGSAASHVADTCLPVEAHVVVVDGDDNNTVLYELGPGAPCTTPTPTPPPCNIGLIHNGGFETGNFTSWVIDSTDPSPVVTNALSYSGRFSAFVGGNPPACNFAASAAAPSGDSSFYQAVRAGACWHSAKLLALGL